MKNIYILILGMAAVFGLSACEDVVDDPVPVTGNDDLVVEILDDNVATRAAYSGFSSTMETGDEIGIYAASGSGFAVQNVKFTRQSDGSWTPASRVQYNPSYTYFAYFPYRSDPGYTPATTGAVDTRFAAFISDPNNKFWAADQSTKAKFTSANLCIGQGTHVGSGNKVSFTLEHKRGLAVFEGDGLSEHTFTTNLPYAITSSRKMFLMKPSTSTTIGGYSLSAASGKYVTQNIVTDYLQKYFTVTALESGSFWWDTDNMAYSLDNGTTWTNINAEVHTPTVAAGSKILWKSRSELTPGEEGVGAIYSSGSFDVSGNAMSLLYSNSFQNKTSLAGKDYALAYLFYENENVRDAGSLKLPATTLSQYCYINMFINCTSLTTPPELPATTLTDGCYYGMFEGCTSLTTAPELPAKTLTNACYYEMFKGCTSLTTAPELPATTLVTGCYHGLFNGCTHLNYIKAAFTTTPDARYYTNNWVNGVAASGTFYKNSAATWSGTGKAGVPSGWTVITYTP